MIIEIEVMEKDGQWNIKVGSLVDINRLSKESGIHLAKMAVLDSILNQNGIPSSICFLVTEIKQDIPVEEKKEAVV